MERSAQTHGWAWTKWLSRAEAAALNALLVLALVFVLLQVISRNIFDQPLAWTDEASRLALIWLTFIGAGYLMSQGRHLAVDALSLTLPLRARMVTEVVSNVLVVIVCAAIAFAGLGFVNTVSRSESAALSISMGWFYGPAVLGLILIVVHAVLNSIGALREGAPIYSSSIQEEGAAST